MSSDNYLLQLNDEEFRDLVERDVKGKLDPITSALMRDPRLTVRRSASLRMWKIGVEGQLAARRADAAVHRLEYLARFNAATTPEARTVLEAARQAEELAYERWRGGAIRFRTAVEQALVGLTQTAALAGDPDADRLRAAIDCHRNSIDADETTDADIALWATIGGPGVPVDSAGS